MDTDRLCQVSASALQAAFRAEQMLPSLVCEAILRRIDQLEGTVNAFAHLDPDEVRRQAKASDERWHRACVLGPLDGVPVTIKDMILTAGTPTLRGSLAIDEAGDWSHDAPAVARLREGGAILLGKTTMAEFGWKGTGDCPRHGVTTNPLVPGRTPGGSSSGAAAGLAAGFGPLALGTDAGGSVRIPAAFTGTVGFKATFGTIPSAPASPMDTLSNVAPMARTVEDVALLYACIAQPDARDAWFRPPDIETRSWRQLRRGRPLAGFKVAVAPTMPHVRRVTPGPMQALNRAAECLTELGAAVQEVQPDFGDVRSTFLTLWRAGAAFLANSLDPQRRAQLDPGLQEEARIGQSLTGADYVQAQMSRSAIASAMTVFLSRWDVLLTPTVATPPPRLGEDLFDPGVEDHWIDWTPFTYPFNLSRHPAISLSAGEADGVPVGVQLVGQHGTDHDLLGVARRLETELTDQAYEALA